MSRREKMIALVAAAVVGLFLAERYLLRPVLGAYTEAGDRRDGLSGKLQKADALLNRRRVLADRRRKMVADGLRNDPAEAESGILHAVGDWARKAGLRLTAVKPKRAQDPETGQLREIAFDASGSGDMAAVSRFLYLLETARMPVRIESIQLGSRKSGQDDLTMQLRFSTIYEAKADPAARRTRQGGPS